MFRGCNDCKTLGNCLNRCRLTMLKQFFRWSARTGNLLRISLGVPLVYDKISLHELWPMQCSVQSTLICLVTPSRPQYISLPNSSVCLNYMRPPREMEIWARVKVTLLHMSRISQNLMTFCHNVCWKHTVEGLQPNPQKTRLSWISSEVFSERITRSSLVYTCGHQHLVSLCTEAEIELRDMADPYLTSASQLIRFWTHITTNLPEQLF